jgi:hypothetical protein
MCRIFLALCLGFATALHVQAACAAGPVTPPHSRHFENPYLSLQILPVWTIAPPNQHAGDCCTLTITNGRYVLAINPLFEHASGISGGRFSEILRDQPSVQAVMGDVDLPAGGFECSVSSTPDIRVNSEITLGNLYTDPTKAKGNQYGCRFPVKPSPVWFASFSTGEGPETDYSITLTYDSADINALPRKGSPELAHVLDQVVRMLRTLVLKPPIVITKIAPTSGPPGATVTVDGKGFALPRHRARAVFKEFPNSASLVTQVAPDGKSLHFVVPDSITTIACPPGEIDVNENCVAIPPGHIDVNDCLPNPHKSCSIPIPPATYHLKVEQESASIWSSAIPFTVLAPPPSAVSLLLLYPAYYVQLGDFVTLRGKGFTPTGNTVHVGSLLVPNLASANDSIRFPVPDAAVPHSSPTFPVFVSNAKGVSNALALAYRAKPNRMAAWPHGHRPSWAPTATGHRPGARIPD